MRRLLSAVVVMGALAAPTLAVAAPAASAASAKATKATHSTTGVVKSVSDDSLVVTRAGKKRRELSFKLEPSTKRQGTIDVGSSVSIRYHVDGKTLVATAVTARPPARHS